MGKTFVPMKEVLEELTVVRGYDSAGRRRRVTIDDLVKMTDEQRAQLAIRVLLKKKAK